MSIKIDNLADAIAQELHAYKQEVTDGVKKSVKKAAKACADELRVTSPKDTGEYAQSWRTRAAYEDDYDIRMEVYNRDHHQLTHLLEDGFAHVGGGRVTAQPHIGPAADNAATLLEKDIKVKVGMQ